MVAKKFQIYSAKITGKYIVIQELDMFIFTQTPKQNSPPRFLSLSTQAESNYPLLPSSVFWRSFFSPAVEKIWKFGDEKITKMKPARV